MIFRFDRTILACLFGAATCVVPALAAELKIGVLVPTTGSAAGEGQDMKNAVLVAIDELNRRGGANTFAAVISDDGCDPQQAVNAAGNLAASGVVAVIGGYCPEATIPALKVFESAKLPFVVTGANSPDLISANPGEAFVVSPTAKDQVAKAVDVWTARGVKSLAIVDEGNVSSRALARLAQTSFSDAGGTVTAFETVDQGTQDYSEVVSKISAANPSAVFWTANGGDGATLIKQLRDNGYQGVVYLGGAAASVDLSGLGGAAGSVYAFSSPTARYMKSAEAFRNAYKQKFSIDPGYGVLSYDGMKLIDAAITGSSDTDGASLIAALQRSDFKDGITGEISFLPTHTLAHSNVILLQWGEPGWMEDRGIVCPPGQAPCGNSCCVK